MIQVAPILAPLAGAKQGQAAALSANFTDDSGNTHTTVWDWGDGQTSAGTVTGQSVSGSHTYTAAGVYRVVLTVTDQNSNSAQSEILYLGVYHAPNGYINGTGQTASPVGSYPANPTAAGSATLTQIYAKYNASGLLTGLSNVFKWNYSAGPLVVNGNAATMHWLVKTGNQSWLRGEGLTGSGIQCYYLFAVKNNTGTPDCARLKVVRKDNGQVIYDNQMNDPDDAVPNKPMTAGGVNFL